MKEISSEDLKHSLKLAGILALKANSLINSNSENIGINVANLKNALKEYDNFILKLL